MPKRPDLIRWQWELYPEGHATRRNLALHLFAVPLFDLGLAGAVAAPVLGAPLWAIGAGLGAAAVGFGIQGAGHKGEPVAPVPFAGPIDVLTRILTEQYFTWWRFLASGGFARAWRAAS
jgi:hypothetical protein